MLFYNCPHFSSSNLLLFKRSETLDQFNQYDLYSLVKFGLFWLRNRDKRCLGISSIAKFMIQYLIFQFITHVLRTSQFNAPHIHYYS